MGNYGFKNPTCVKDIDSICTFIETVRSLEGKKKLLFGGAVRNS